MAVNRLRSRFEEEQASIAVTLRGLQEGCTRFEAAVADRAIQQARTTLEEVAQAYDALILAQRPRPAPLQEQDRDQSYRAGCKWLGNATNRLWSYVKEEESATKAVPVVVAPGRGHLERVQLPRFSGQPEDWADFKRIFTELTEAEGYSATLLLAQLRTRLPKEALKLIQGVVEPKEAWKRLSDRYGDKTLAILTARHRLVGHQVSKGPPHEQFESLSQALQSAKTSLDAVGAKHTLFQDVALIGTLLSKVPPSYQERWHLYCTNPSNITAHPMEGDRFEAWMEQERAAATAARLMHLGCQLGKVGTSNEMEKDRCTRCGKQGHKATACSIEPTYLGEAFAMGAEGDGGSWTSSRPKAEEKKRETKVKFGTCPLCNRHHTFERKFTWGSMDWPSQRLEACDRFRAMTLQERGRCLEEHGGCARCTSRVHKSEDCYQVKFKKTTPCPQMDGNRKCGRPHHYLLHGSGNIYCQAN